MSLFAPPAHVRALQERIKVCSAHPLFLAAAKSLAYYNGQAYDRTINPGNRFAQWDESREGPRPLCLQLGKIIIDSGAEMLFSDTPKISVPESDDLEEFVLDMIRANALEAKLLPQAKLVGNEGSTWVKYSWTPQNKRRPVGISFYSPWEVEATRDPLDADIITRVSLRVKYQDAEGKWWIHREDWTDTEYVLYQSLETREREDSLIFAQMQNGEWPVQSTEPNRYGVIPFVQIYNHRIAGDTDGVGDLWTLYDALDQLNLTHWLQHHSNQADGDPILAIVNASSAPDNIPPGSIIKLQGTNADIKRLEPSNNLREHMRTFAQDLEALILDAAGADRPNYAEIGLKGNLTRAVMEFVYARSVKSTKEKRTYWGAFGLEIFFELMLEGLSRLPDAVAMFPALAGVDVSDTSTYNVTVQWPPLFSHSPEERTAAVQDIIAALEAGLITREAAIEQIAAYFDIPVEEMKEELLSQIDSVSPSPVPDDGETEPSAPPSSDDSMMDDSTMMDGD